MKCLIVVCVLLASSSAMTMREKRSVQQLVANAAAPLAVIVGTSDQAAAAVPTADSAVLINQVLPNPPVSVVAVDSEVQSPAENQAVAQSAVISDVEPPVASIATDKTSAVNYLVSNDAGTEPQTAYDTEMLQNGDYFFTEPLGMLYGDNYQYQRPAMMNAVPNGNANSASYTPEQVIELDNVFYFTKATSLIAEVESLLEYEEQLFQSPSFKEYLENPPPAYDEYEIISFSSAPNAAQPPAAQTAQQ